MLRLIASTSPSELPGFVAALNEAIDRWATAAVSEPASDLEAELTRLHALKSITSALGSLMIASACEDLADCLWSGVETDVVRRRSRAVAASAQRLLQRSINLHR